MLKRASSHFSRLEFALTGPLTAMVRANTRIELAASLVYGPFQAALMFIPVILQRLGGTSELIAWYQSISYVGFLVIPFTSSFIPQHNTQHYLARVWGFGRALFLLIALATNAPFVFVVASVFFFFDSFPTPGYTQIIQQIYPANVRGRALGYVRLGLAIGMLVFTPICGWMLDHIGYRWLLPIAALFGVAAAWVFAQLKVNSATPTSSPTGLPKRSASALWQVCRSDRRYQIFLLSVIFFGFAGLIPISFIPAILVDRLKLSYTEVSALGSTQSVCWLIGYVMWGHLQDRRNGIWTLRVIYAMMAIIPATYWFASSGWMLFPAYIIQGLAAAGIDLAFQSCIIDLADPDQVYEYAALHRTVIGIRGLIGPLLGVWLAQIGVPVGVIFVLGSALYLCASALVLHPVFTASSR